MRLDYGYSWAAFLLAILFDSSQNIPKAQRHLSIHTHLLHATWLIYLSLLSSLHDPVAELWGVTVI